MSWASRIISVVLLFDLTLTLGQLTCDYSLYSRFRCTRFARGAVVTPAQCRAAGCCYDLFSTAAPSTRCFLAREEVNMRFKPTVHPNTGQQNGLLTLGGLSTRDGNIVVRKCNVANRRPCGNSRTTKSRCESFSCCWHNRTESCHHASHYIIRQKKACEAGFTNPPVCSDIDECASSPCQNGGVCVNLKNKFRCDCPPNIQGTTCTNVCGQPPVIANANVPPVSTYNAGNTYTYACTATYQLVGASVVTCMVSGSWSPSPQCVKVCMSPPKAQSVTASPVLTSYSVGHVVTYSCPTGSTLTGASTNHCLGTGQWLGPSPTCGICAPLPFMGNLVYTPVQSSYAVGETITYNCASGYTLVGNPQASCQATNSFAPSTPPTCSNTVCPQVPSVSGASFTPDVATTPNVAVGNTATYTCNTGFTLTGPATITCSTGGVWVFPQGPTVCNPGCTAPPPITVGTGTVTTGTNFPIGIKVTYACTFPPTLVGSAESTCLASGWSNPPPTCQQVCLLPTPAANIILTPNSPTFQIGEPITFSCPPTHVFNPAGTSVLTCTSPSYMFSVPVTNNCLIKCGTPPTTNTGISSAFTTRPVTGETVEGTVITYSCPGPNDAPRGATVNNCLNTGAWSLPTMADTATCVATCSDPPASSGAPTTITPSTGPYFTSTTVQYTCQSGSSPSTAGSDSLTCNSPNWSPSTGPLCATNCGPPPAITSNGVAAPAGPYIITFSFPYACASGYSLRNPVTNTCQLQAIAGVWSVSTAPICVADNRNLDLLFIMEGNDNVETQTCTELETSFSDTRPIGPSGVLTSANFPRFFQQQAFLTHFESTWNAVTQTKTRMAVQMHNGGCLNTFAAAPNSVRLLKSNIDLATYWMTTNQYRCGTATPRDNLVCAYAYHFTTTNGDTANQDVIIFALPDVLTATGYGALRNTQLLGVDATRANLPPIYTVSLLETSDPNYAANANYAREFACGTGNSLTSQCTRFLGSIYEIGTAVNVLATAFPA